MISGSIKHRWRDTWAPVAVALVLFAGAFKTAPALERLPDLTAIGALFVLFAISGALVGRRSFSPPRTLVVLIVAFLISMFRASGYDYSAAKTQGLYLTLVVVIGAVVLIDTEVRRKAFLWAMVVASLVLALTAGADAAGRVTSLSGSTIEAGRVAGSAIVVLVTLVLTGEVRGVKRACAVAAAGWLTVTLIGSGSRGPVVAAALALVVAVLLGSRGNRWIRSAGAVLAVACGWILLNLEQSAGGGRIAASFNGEVSLTGTRDLLWRRAFEHALSDPIGVGLGQGWTVLQVGGSARQYPHNVILEAGLEGGWLAAGAVLLFLAVGLGGLRRDAVTPYGTAVFAVAIFFVANAMVSGDFNDNRAMWAFVALGLVEMVKSGMRATEIRPPNNHDVAK